MAKKRQHKNQSLVKNIALLFLSLGILAGASILFSTVNGRSDFTFDPLHSRWSSLIDGDSGNRTPKKAEEKEKATASAFEYTYWDILLLHDDTASSNDNNYSIQIASFKSNEQAVIFAKSIREKTRLQCKVVNTGKWSAVRWGSFSTKDSAQKYCRELSGKLDRECIVIRM